MSGFFGWLSSAFIHVLGVGIILAFLFGVFGEWSKAPPAGDSNIVPIDIVNLSDYSNIKAIAADAQRAPVDQPDPQGAPQPDAAPQDEVEPIPDKTAKPPPKPEKPRQRPNLDQFSALIDKAQKNAGQSQQQTSTDAERGPNPRKGVGAGDNLTANERDLLRSKLETCWRSNADQADPARSRVTVRFLLNRDGTLRGDPKVTAPAFISPTDTALKAAARNAVNAVRECAPFKGFRAERYANWRDISSNFGANGVE